MDSLPPGADWTCNLFELEGDELDEEDKPKKEVIEL